MGLKFGCFKSKINKYHNKIDCGALVYRISVLITNQSFSLFSEAAMDLASSQGAHEDDHEVRSVHARESDSSGGAEGEKGNQDKVDAVVAKLANQVVNRLSSQTDNFSQTAKNIQTLAEAVKSFREDMKSLKRKTTEEQEEVPPIKKKSNLQERKVETPENSPRPGTSAEALSDTDDSEDELDRFLEPKESIGADNPYAELEDFYQVEDETGKEVGEHIAGICNRVLRSSKSKKEEEKVQKIIQQHLRLKNIENLQVPKVDSQLWLQLNRDVKRVDYIQQQAVAAYGQAMVPLIKVMEAAEKQDKTVNTPSLVSDAFKILSWNIKQTNLKRLDRIQKELQPKYRTLCQDGPSATNLLGDNFQEGTKKLDTAKGNLTVNTNYFFRRRGADGSQTGIAQHKIKETNGTATNTAKKDQNST